jgi:hypothetical protein
MSKISASPKVLISSKIKPGTAHTKHLSNVQSQPDMLPPPTKGILKSNYGSPKN